jgi:hypothetical protein
MADRKGLVIPSRCFVKLGPLGFEPRTKGL